MENKSKDIINDLNELVQINNDRIDGYKTAMQETDESDLKELFKDMAKDSFDFRNELSNEIIVMGGEPVTTTKASGKVYRAWMDIKAALSTKERQAILNSCEFGEDMALETYDNVLKKSSLSPTVNYMVTKQRERLKQDHDKIKALRDSARQQSR